MRFFAKKGEKAILAFAFSREKARKNGKTGGLARNSSSVPPLYFISLLRIDQMQIHPAILSRELTFDTSYVLCIFPIAVCKNHHFLYMCII